MPVPIIVAWYFIYATVSLDQIRYGSNILQTYPSEHSGEAVGRRRRRRPTMAPALSRLWWRAAVSQKLI